MNKAKKTLLVITISSLVIAACKPALFKSIKVKAEPEFKLNLGSTEFKSDDFLSAKKISELSQGNNKFINGRFFKYKKNAEDKDVKFLLHYPITDIDFDMNKNTDVLKKLEEKINKTLENKEFLVPKIDKTKANEADLSFVNDLIKDMLVIRDKQTTVPEGVSGEATLPDIPVNFGDKIKTIEFADNAELNIKIEKINASNNFTLKISKIIFTDESGANELLKREVSTLSDNLSISLKDVTFKNKMKLKLTLKSSGGTFGNNADIKIKTSITGDVKKATGLKIDERTENIPENLLPIEGEFKEAEILHGGINIKQEIPTGWEGISITPQIHTYQENGLNIPLAVGNNDLNGKKINNKKVKISGTVKIKADNATYVYHKSPKAVFKYKLNITKFTYVDFIMNKDFNPEYEEKKPVSDDLKKWVKEIKFSALKTEITINNRLPPGNDITVKISSNSFGMGESDPAYTKDFPSGQENSKTIEKLNQTVKPGEIPEFDVKVKIGFAGYDKTNNILKINNVIPDEKISLSGSATVTPDWEYAIIKPGQDGILNDKFPKEPGTKMDFSPIRKFLKPEIEIKDVNAYIYANSQVLNKKTSKMQASMYAAYTKSGSIVKEYISGDTVSSQNIEFSDKLPQEFYTHDTEKEYIGDIPKAAIQKDISKIINYAPSDLEFFYKFQLDEVKITKADTDKTKDKKMHVDLILELPLKLNVASEAEVLKLENNADILTSASKAEGSPIDEVFSSINNVKMHVEYKNEIGLQIAAEIILKNQDEKELLTKKLELIKGEGKIDFEINSEDIKKVRGENNIFSEFRLLLPKGEYAMVNGSSIKMSASVSSKLKVDKNFDVFK